MLETKINPVICLQNISQIKEYDKAGFYFIIASTYISTGKYRKALPWINKLINYAEVRLEHQPTIRLLNIILHYELGNTDMLNSIVKSTYHYLDKKGKLHRFENIMLRYLNTISGIKSDQQLRASFTELKKSLAPLASAPWEK